ncbi:hypothetical protein [Herbaspirillum robiniae]|uniref:Uncharacterized protein n=1 Tax=Herbaspirillum robiniae TaxID=2014887 RepID=A0A246WMM3_9BURK|nr:hypothetical protein [Herbaspirillum robiniae]OWY26642.1 hypothetical protein CEJ42_23055 [Herbaspirillum robiniae]
MTKDTGGWLSAEQAVLPDGTLRTNLPLINTRLPSLAGAPADLQVTETDREQAVPAASKDDS